ncbi:hypothetical protein K505DRAFT_310041 [Melanomma pulvis-pyrius CBS 109.77]|uniref:Uncharacterized protein n=1 Tax=Melanomma pulvis-pyrius CBS 109.77 TaxID=1314802 RepID=A0A6A6X490_9PLEO|nr:hypothetical protein K505DRAFT_310041 [Melanomma pulvis-pyrius CBS 109.77]
MSDVDGDSNMHSSPELDAEDEMFPDEASGPAGPSTPRNAASFSTGIGPTSELSPPNSQGGHLPRDDSFSATFSGSPSALNANGKRVYGTVPTSSTAGGGESANLHEDKETGYQWAKAEEQPGWDWNNTKARDEEKRALDQIVDKNFMIRTRYGDTLDPSVPAKKR